MSIKPNAPAPETLSVSQLNRKVKNLLEGSFEFIWVEGEVSNFAAPGSGHWYFSLKDGDAQVRCAMFRNRNQRLRFKPGNGDHLRLRARVSLYEGRGEFQLIVEFAEPAGAGALQAAFEQLRTRLGAEGLFDSERKRPLPTEVQHLGIVTSPTGAAIHDILTVLRRRWPAMSISILPVAVQGAAAAGEIASAILRANRLQAQGRVRLDALIVGRGGGSLEDLWAFNEEVVARAIAASELPIVSAVGHEVDVTIADMAADVRAATPSAAAELLSPDREERAAQLNSLEQQLRYRIQGRLREARSKLQHLQQRLRHPGQQLQEQAQRLDELEQRLQRARRNHLQARRTELQVLHSRLLARSPLHSLHRLSQTLHSQRQRLQNGVLNRLQGQRRHLASLAQLLDSVSPLATLERGYAIVRNENGEVLRDPGQVIPGQALTAQLARGELALRVDSPDSQPEQGRQD